MKNIKDIIGELGIELDEAKLGDLEKAVLENYRTVAEVENKQSRISEAWSSSWRPPTRRWRLRRTPT